MSRFHRKTAPGVRAGRTLRKNNWALSAASDRSGRVPVIDRQRPGPGYRHLLLKRDIERFVQLIPDWDKLAVGLDVIVLTDGRYTCDGWYNQGVIGLPAWPVNLRYGVKKSWLNDHRAFLERIEARIEHDKDEPGEFIVHWTPNTARAYQLCHVFLHELGHHADRMHTRTKTDNGPRGEPFAEDYAFDLEARVLERYFEEFGLPE
jgi:hypothetical protein